MSFLSSLRRRIPLLPALCLLAILSGCQTESELGGAGLPNVPPETFLTGNPPVLLESASAAHFYWSGDDVDGQIVGFQWKLCEIGDDGISVQDTITFDPVTGAALHPWVFTTETDTILIVTADHPGYPGDDDLVEERRRSYATHTFLIRAVDDHGQVDRTPAMMSFTAVTLVPRITIDRPATLAGYRTAQGLAPTVTFGWTGYDRDSPHHQPTAVRYLWKRALLDGQYIASRYAMDPIMDELVSWSDTAWSDWIPYDPDPQRRKVVFENQPQIDEQDRRIYYVFAIQVRDTTGAVSLERSYGRTVHNIWVRDGYSPRLTVADWYLGSYNAFGMNQSFDFDIVPGQALNFAWAATAENYNGEVVAYRYGWDVLDPDDPQDPGWAVPRGNTAAHRVAPERSFASDTHTLTIQCWDQSDGTARVKFVFNVLPVPDREDRRPLLLIDSVYDRTSHGWVSMEGDIAYNSDFQRDEFWRQTLEGPGGVYGFDHYRDVIDREESPAIGFRDVVDYRMVLYTASYGSNPFDAMAETRTPAQGELLFNFWSIYQESVGNVFFVGDRILNRFCGGGIWVCPIIFDSTLPDQTVGWVTYRRGFGELVLPSGERISIGEYCLPYFTLGVAAIDHVTPPYPPPYHIDYWYNYGDVRNNNCVGVKALVLDPAFRARHVPDAAFPDTIFTDARIDWRDSINQISRDGLAEYGFMVGEVYDEPITRDGGVISPQDCGGEPCVEPMFRVYSRYAWVRDLHIADGDFGWPVSFMGVGWDSVAKCGDAGLDPATDLTTVDGATIGFLSHKLDGAWEGRPGDVVWGFWPSLFDHESMRQTVRWMIEEHFGLLMRP